MAHKTFRWRRRPGFTLIELLVAMAIIGVIAGVVLVAINPRKNLKETYNVMRLHDDNQQAKAVMQYLIDKWKLPEDGSIPSGSGSAKAICGQNITTSVTCVPLGQDLVPTYLAKLPVDPAAPCTDEETGYAIYKDQNGRVTVVSKFMDKLPGETTGSCGPPWSVFDASAVSGNPAGYAGGAFDGQYVYFAPYEHGGVMHGLAMRYDTHQSFTSGSSWQTYDIASVNPAAKGYPGAVFAKQYVYFAPFTNTSGFFGLVARYNTAAAFNAPGSWEFFDLVGVNPAAKGFQSPTFDGRYVYFTPLGGSFSHAARYDTTLPFGNTGSWEIFDTNVLNAGAEGYNGSAFDGKYVYFAPDNSGVSGFATRFDVSKPFTASGSWMLYDLAANVSANAKGFAGATFDGKYVYLVPHLAGGTYSGLVVRYDTAKSFQSPGSWETFDATAVNANSRGFAGGNFDGRYVYFIPRQTSAGTTDGQVTRYDTQGSFANAQSWSVFDVSTLDSAAKGFYGSIFDGHFLYFVPYDTGNSGKVARYNTGSPFVP